MHNYLHQNLFIFSLVIINSGRVIIQDNAHQHQDITSNSIHKLADFYGKVRYETSTDIDQVPYSHRSRQSASVQSDLPVSLHLHVDSGNLLPVQNVRLAHKERLLKESEQIQDSDFINQVKVKRQVSEYKRQKTEENKTHQATEDTDGDTAILMVIAINAAIDFTSDRFRAYIQFQLEMFIQEASLHAITHPVSNYPAFSDDSQVTTGNSGNFNHAAWTSGNRKVHMKREANTKATYSMSQNQNSTAHSYNTSTAPEREIATDVFMTSPSTVTYEMITQPLNEQEKTTSDKAMHTENSPKATSEEVIAAHRESTTLFTTTTVPIVSTADQSETSAMYSRASTSTDDEVVLPKLTITILDIKEAATAARRVQRGVGSRNIEVKFSVLSDGELLESKEVMELIEQANNSFEYKIQTIGKAIATSHHEGIRLAPNTANSNQLSTSIEPCSVIAILLGSLLGIFILFFIAYMIYESEAEKKRQKKESQIHKEIDLKLSTEKEKYLSKLSTEKEKYLKDNFNLKQQLRELEKHLIAAQRKRSRTSSLGSNSDVKEKYSGPSTNVQHLNDKSLPIRRQRAVSEGAHSGSTGIQRQQ